MWSLLSFLFIASSYSSINLSSLLLAVINELLLFWLPCPSDEPNLAALSSKNCLDLSFTIRSLFLLIFGWKENLCCCSNRISVRFFSIKSWDFLPFIISRSSGLLSLARPIHLETGLIWGWKVRSSHSLISLSIFSFCALRSLSSILLTPFM